MICPSQCVCQYSPFMDLSIARWIQGMRRENFEDAVSMDDDNMRSNEVCELNQFSFFHQISVCFLRPDDDFLFQIANIQFLIISGIFPE